MLTIELFKKIVTDVRKKIAIKNHTFNIILEIFVKVK